jgi:hypothetical protein
MADTVDTITQISGSKRVVRRFTNISDGTGESAVVKFDRSTFTKADGTEPTRLNIEWVEWSIQGIKSVRVHWDNTADDEALVLSGPYGFRDFRAGLLCAPLSATTGDILFTTAPIPGAAGDTYDIVMSVILS